MAEIRSLFELTPAELRKKPALRRFLPCRQQTVRFGWFKWYWLGRCVDSKHTLLIGPFWTRGGAKRAWDKVPLIEGPEGQIAQLLAELSPHERSLQQSFSDYHRG